MQWMQWLPQCVKAPYFKLIDELVALPNVRRYYRMSRMGCDMSWYFVLFSLFSPSMIYALIAISVFLLLVASCVLLGQAVKLLDDITCSEPEQLNAMLVEHMLIPQTDKGTNKGTFNE
ncbi:hypothetical protein [uncultured Shewanella sp.]|uniref:hypothetical protein n=1 Tax=uncultured Shewanella sp. TaxID=173975 RepID=UPI0026071FB1|nr:hypothetical protein [uncultured Shewanella sp.]